MSRVLRISEAAALALHAMMILAANRNRVISTPKIASALGASATHLSKVLQRLARVGLVRSIQGPRGGFVLGKSIDSVTLLEIYESIEGPLVLQDCLFSTPICSGDQCVLSRLVKTVNDQIHRYFAQTRLSELTYLHQEKSPLEE